MNNFLFLILLFTSVILLVCCSNSVNEENEFEKGSNVIVSRTEKNVYSALIDSIANVESFFKQAEELKIPFSINANERVIKISEIQNGIYKGKQLPPLSKNFANTIKKVAIKRYIAEAVKKYYSFNEDLSNYILGNYDCKFFALGKINFLENNLASQIIYIELTTSNSIAKFAIMVNYDTNFQVFLHSALIAMDINSSSENSNYHLTSNLSNVGNNTVLIKQKYGVNGIEKKIDVEINKAFYYSPPAEGGPNPKDYIRYLN